MSLSNDPFQQFSDAHQPHQPCKKYLDKKISREGVSYQVVDQPPEALANYTYHRLKELSHELAGCSRDSEKYQKLSSTIQLIYSDYKQESKQQGWLSKFANFIFAAFGIRKSSDQIETIYQKLQQAIPEQRLGGSLAQKESADIKERIDRHRQPATEGYGQVALTKTQYEPLFKAKREAAADQFAAIDNDSTVNDAAKIQKKSILEATLKEEACKETYANHMQNCVQAGFYDPAIIPRDIERLLGPLEPLSQTIKNRKELNQLLKKEVLKCKEKGHLTNHQAGHILEDALKIAKRYLEVFPEKNPRDAFLLTRDLIRIATYQEYYDKSSFNGSDHGSKHIHNNILNASSMHKGMDKGKDYNKKDKFVEQLIHFYHDIGYTVGLASTDFDCCKDHPFIGAAMIEANKDYFLHFLDETCYKTLHECVLCHAIVNPDLTAHATAEGIHPSMIRAVTSISDACAVTYDRKTQEFWEQPRALVALARLKTFLVLYPEYKDKLGDDIVKGPWEGYDENNPWDKMAYDIFKNTVNELHEMVNTYDIPEEKKDLFRQAIRSQFNAFKTNVTLGQYGAVLVGVEAIPNPDKQNAEEALPDYITKISLAPSLIYGLLKDLFGADQANEAFKKLTEEFKGDRKKIEKELKSITNKMDQNQRPKAKNVKTGVAVFRLLNRCDHDSKHKHAKDLQRNLKQAMAEIHETFKGEQQSRANRTAAIKALDDWKEDPKGVQLSEFINTSIIPLLPQSAAPASIMRLINIIRRAGDPITDEQFKELRNTVRLLLISEKEYVFMRGQAPETSREAILQSPESEDLSTSLSSSPSTPSSISSGGGDRLERERRYSWSPDAASPGPLDLRRAVSESLQPLPSLPEGGRSSSSIHTSEAEEIEEIEDEDEFLDAEEDDAVNVEAPGVKGYAPIAEDLVLPSASSAVSNDVPICGIANPGSTNACNRIAVLQCLLRLPSFVAVLEQPLERKNGEDDSKFEERSSIQQAFQSLINAMRSGEADPHDLIALEQITIQMMNQYLQRDGIDLNRQEDVSVYVKALSSVFDLHGTFKSELSDGGLPLIVSLEGGPSLQGVLDAQVSSREEDSSNMHVTDFAILQLPLVEQSRNVRINNAVDFMQTNLRNNPILEKLFASAMGRQQARLEGTELNPLDILELNKKVVDTIARECSSDALSLKLQGIVSDSKELLDDLSEDDVKVMMDDQLKNLGINLTDEQLTTLITGNQKAVDEIFAPLIENALQAFNAIYQPFLEQYDNIKDSSSPDSAIQIDLDENYQMHGGKEYQIASFVVYTGSGDRGHYRSFVRDRENQWWEVNDDKVTPREGHEVEAVTKEAYLLFMRPTT